MLVALAFGLAWLLGGFLGAEWLARLWPGPSLREHGSGNPGASNALRVRGKAFAALVLCWDVVKAVLAVWGLTALFGPHLPQLSGQSLQYLLGLAVVAGHLWPPLHGFKGGKGVATALGVLLCVLPTWAPWLLLAWLLVFLSSGYSGLASAVAALLLPLSAMLFGDAESGRALTAFCLMLSALVLGAHRLNLQRLLRGQEPRYHLPWL